MKKGSKHFILGFILFLTACVFVIALVSLPAYFMDKYYGQEAGVLTIVGEIVLLVTFLYYLILYSYLNRD
jgi:hypothetical protein